MPTSTPAWPKAPKKPSAWRISTSQFAVRHGAALQAIDQRLGLPYVAIACAETRAGELLIFEVDNAMVVHAMDPEDMFPYRKPAMRKVFSAVTRWRDPGSAADRRTVDVDSGEAAFLPCAFKASGHRLRQAQSSRGRQMSGPRRTGKPRRSTADEAGRHLKMLRPEDQILLQAKKRTLCEQR